VNKPSYIKEKAQDKIYHHTTQYVYTLAENDYFLIRKACVTRSNNS